MGTFSHISVVPDHLCTNFCFVQIDSYVEIFPNVSHGWTVRYDPKDPSAVKAADKAHQIMIGWFDKHLKWEIFLCDVWSTGEVSLKWHNGGSHAFNNWRQIVLLLISELYPYGFCRFPFFFPLLSLAISILFWQEKCIVEMGTTSRSMDVLFFSFKLNSCFQLQEASFRS